jgi:hypothetical protein
MEERESESKINITGVEIVAELGSGLVVAKVDINLIREQDKNARVMKPEMFRQLYENIKKRGTLESLPYCVLTDKVEVISGHHRLRAAKEAGLKFIFVLLDTSGLNRSQIAAKQIAHNSLNGFDDQSMLREIAQMISDVDDMIESYIGKEILGEPLAELDKLISPIVNFDWKEVEFIFLPHQIKSLEKLVAATSGSKAYIAAAHIDQYEKLIETLQLYQSFANIKNTGAAIHAMIETTLEQMNDAEYSIENSQWVPFTRLFGSGAIPKETFDAVTEVIDGMKKKGVITDKTKWKALEIMAGAYTDHAPKKKAK